MILYIIIIHNFPIRLRGVPSREVDKVVDWALKKLDLLQFADRPCRTYSGGNRRKISTAIALIGSPALIFLVRIIL